MEKITKRFSVRNHEYKGGFLKRRFQTIELLFDPINVIESAMGIIPSVIDVSNFEPESYDIKLENLRNDNISFFDPEYNYRIVGTGTKLVFCKYYFDKYFKKPADNLYISIIR